MDLNETQLELRASDDANDDGNETNNNFIQSKEMIKSVLSGDTESTQSCDGCKNDNHDTTATPASTVSPATNETREERLKRVKDRSEAERQRKLADIAEAQRQSQQLRMRQQVERRKRIDELRQREEERRRGVEQRRRENDEREKEKFESFQKRNREREARAASLCASGRGCVMSQSMLISSSSSMSSSNLGGGASGGARHAASLLHMSSSVHTGNANLEGSSHKCTRRTRAGYRSSSSSRSGYRYRYTSGAGAGLGVVTGTVSRSCDQSPSGGGYIRTGAGPVRFFNTDSNDGSARSCSGRHRSNTGNTGTGGKGRQPPEGCIEIEPGVFIPASTRHAGCFLPFRGESDRLHRVRGVLSWGPRPSSGTSSGAGAPAIHVSGPPGIGKGSRASRAVSWWAPLSSDTVTNNGGDDSLTDTNNHDSQRHLKEGGSKPQNRLSSTTKSQQSARGSDKTERPVPSARGDKNAINNSSNNNTGRKARDKTTIFDRLSKPRSGSQPPKSVPREPLESAGGNKTMTTSLTKQRSTAVPTKSTDTINTTTTGAATVLKKKKQQPVIASPSVPPVAPPASLPHSPSTNTLQEQLTSLPSATEPADSLIDQLSSSTNPPLPVITPVDSDNNTETAVISISDPVDQQPLSVPAAVAASNKSGSRRGSKNLTKAPENPEPAVPSSKVGEEATYKMKLAEQRRLAREKKEEQMEEQRRIEEEARQKVLLEKKRIEEETRKVMEEEAQRVRLEEEERLAELEKQRLFEESERKKKEDSEREIEEKRLEKLRLEEEARMDRKRRLEKIMSRVKRQDEPSQSNDDNSSIADNLTVTETVESSTNPDDRNESLMEISLEENCLKIRDNLTKEDDNCQPTIAWAPEEEPIKLEEKNTGESVVNLKGDLSEENVTEESRNDSPEMISETVLNLAGPQSITAGNSQSLPEQQVAPPTPLHPNSASSSSDQAPVFKSRLLQSMLGSGRLNSNKVQDDRSINMNTSSNSFTAQKEKRNSCLVSPNICESLSISESVPHSKSCNSDMNHIAIDTTSVNGILGDNQSINGLSHESQSGPSLINGNCNQSDTFNEISLSNLSNNIDPPELTADKSDLHSDSPCSQPSSDDCRAAPVPPHSQPLELS